VVCCALPFCLVVPMGNYQSRTSQVLQGKQTTLGGA